MSIKQFISASAAAVLLISAFPLASSAEETDTDTVMPQDINADGKLSSKDLVAFMKIIAEN